MDLNANNFTLNNLSKINIILGKNGSGKSYLLKQIEIGLQGRETSGKIRYISPERGGLLRYEPGIDQNISENPNWMPETRRNNQSGNFRQQSATLFRRLELLVLREIEIDQFQTGYIPRSFQTNIDLLNTLLERVRIERDENKAFKIIERDTNQQTTPENISSGESELVSLGIEFLAFAKECVEGKLNALFVDEPDVHLHPDLQDRLARFVLAAFKDKPITLVLATHSTALLASLAEDKDARVAFMKRKTITLAFKLVSDADRAILPIFGAHPLSNIFNQAPILLIEGEDDERIWQQVVRSSNGRVRVFPAVVDGLPRFSEFEAEVNNIIGAVYDNAKGFSLRDRDLQPELINDVGHVIRMRLACRAAENLMLTNEVLSSVGHDWGSMTALIEQWIEANHKHPFHADMAHFEAMDLDRKNYDLKNIRNILVGLVSNKPWEVLVGQAIATLAVNGGHIADGSLRDYLGEKVSQQILKLAA
jgi:ABC-type lipoprotein export system ATPase subunit